VGYNVFVTRRIPEAGLDILRGVCSTLEVSAEDRALTAGELLRGVKARDGVLTTLDDVVDRKVIDAALPTVKVFSNYAVGFNNIDVVTATRHGIAVTNTPGVLTDATSDLAWALLFSAARRIAEADRFTRGGRFRGWAPMMLLGADITGATLGVVGAGRIGEAFALKSKGFGMKVLYCDPRANGKLETELGAKRAALDELLREADFVSLHVPLTDETTRLIGGRELGLMKETAVLVNTSRGAVVDEGALVEALRARKIAAAGLDVYEEEPKLHRGLDDCENAVLAPHIGSATTETRGRMSLMAARDLVAVLEGKTPEHCVNSEVFKT